MESNVIHIDEFQSNDGPWNNIDNYLYNNQASIIYRRLYDLFYASFIEDRHYLETVFYNAESCCRLIFLDTHPEINYESYLYYCQPTCTELEYEGGEEQIYVATIITMYTLLKCKRKQPFVIKLFLDSIGNNIDRIYNNYDWKGQWWSQALLIIEDLNNRGGLILDFDIPTVFKQSEIDETLRIFPFSGFDDSDYFWTKEDCMRYVRMGSTPELQNKLYSSIKQAAIIKYNEAVKENNLNLIESFKSACYIKVDNSLNEKQEDSVHVFISELDLPCAYPFQSYITLGALDSIDDLEQTKDNSSGDSEYELLKKELVCEIEKNKKLENKIEELENALCRNEASSSCESILLNNNEEDEDCSRGKVFKEYPDFKNTPRQLVLLFQELGIDFSLTNLYKQNKVAELLSMITGSNSENIRQNLKKFVNDKNKQTKNDRELIQKIIKYIKVEKK